MSALLNSCVCARACVCVCGCVRARVCVCGSAIGGADADGFGRESARVAIEDCRRNNSGIGAMLNTAEGHNMRRTAD